MAPRLSPASVLPAGVAGPDYDRAALRPGILHLGLGAFHRAHQAVFTDAALAEEFDAWGIEAVSLRSAATVHALAEQGGLYSVLVRSGERTEAQVIGSILAGHAARESPAIVLDRLADPAIRIVTLTVTEKAYGLDPATGGLDLQHPDIAADLVRPKAPRGVIGHIVEGLARRRAQSVPPFTVLCCDNLPSNGRVVKHLVREFAERRDAALADWIGENVAFPSSMVDRIVPAPTARTLADAEALIGCRDEAAVETEPFMQWVIEDRFTAGRPRWEAGGALFVTDVEPYERMKLRLLNGAHSLIAYLGQNRGLAYVRDVMAEQRYRELVRAHMREAMATLGPVPVIDLHSYCDALIARFANTAIAHATSQIAMDGTQKLPQRLLMPAAEARRAGREARSFARAVAQWMHYCCSRDAIDDPRQAELLAAAEASRQCSDGISGPFVELPGLFPETLREDRSWRTLLDDELASLRAGRL
jgi:fructuronate reductase